MANEAALKAFEPGLRNAIQRIRDALLNYARSKEWVAESYSIFMVVNTKWRTVSVGLFSSHFDKAKIERFEYLNEVWDFLKSELSDQPEIYKSLGLFLRPIDGSGYSVDHSYGEDMIEVDDEYLNPGKPLRVAPGHTR